MIRVENFKNNYYENSFTGGESAQVSKDRSLPKIKKIEPAKVKPPIADKPVKNSKSSLNTKGDLGWWVLGCVNFLVLETALILALKKPNEQKALAQKAQKEFANIEKRLQGFVPHFEEAVEKKLAMLKNGRVKVTYSGKNAEGRKVTDCLVFDDVNKSITRFVSTKTNDKGGLFLRTYTGDEKLLGKLEELPQGEYDWKYMKKMHVESDPVEFYVDKVNHPDLKRYQTYSETLRQDGTKVQHFRYYSNDKTSVNHNIDHGVFDIEA